MIMRQMTRKASNDECLHSEQINEIVTLFRINEDEFVEEWMTVVFANEDVRQKTVESQKVKSFSVMIKTTLCCIDIDLILKKLSYLP